jgi:hypothetical protein
MKFDVWVFLKKSVAKIQISLTSNKTNKYLVCSPIQVYYNISSNFSQNQNNFNQICTENQETFYVK